MGHVTGLYRANDNTGNPFDTGCSACATGLLYQHLALWTFVDNRDFKVTNVFDEATARKWIVRLRQNMAGLPARWSDAEEQSAIPLWQAMWPGALSP